CDSDIGDTSYMCLFTYARARRGSNHLPPPLSAVNLPPVHLPTPPPKTPGRRPKALPEVLLKASRRLHRAHGPQLRRVVYCAAHKAGLVVHIPIRTQIGTVRLQQESVAG